MGAFEQLFSPGREEFEQGFSKNSNARGVARGWGMLKLRFDWYIIIHRNENKAFFWIISPLEGSKWSQITLCILSNVLTSISERFCLNFEQINIPPRPPPVIFPLEYLGRVRLGSIRNKNNWNNASKRLFGSYSHSGIPGFHSGYSAPRSRIAGIYSGIHSYSGIFPNERALN